MCDIIDSVKINEYILMKKYLLLLICLMLGFVLVVPGIILAVEGDSIDPFKDVPLRTGEAADPTAIIESAITTLLEVIGAIAMLFIVYGGLQWILARGEATKVQEAQSVLTWAIIGLILIFLAFSITKFIFLVVETPVDTTSPPTGSLEEDISTEGTIPAAPEN